ncbi:hypothetical protein OS175_01510 [Marinicella sp. S1101]|uniref:hypothetical protein n=1 Tax=Marinicella marina TaxID=2996016 RepID=UPI002260A9FA|nr:hypothetical protein [Marinicella marina]MCX7552539.1 hypothetical protein [Marinicella marina]MDJ1139415.1 hypothetical protein [Marinicella marina]
MRKYLIAACLTLSLNAQANDDINYNYFELGYDYLDLNNGRTTDGYYLDASFELSDQFYLGGYLNHLESRNIDSKRYGALFGFHQGISNNTDFYTNLRLGQLDLRLDDSFTYGLEIGTRTAFTETFELITSAGYTQVEKANDGFFEASVEGLFKLDESKAFTLGLKSIDGDFGAQAGFRFSF